MKKYKLKLPIKPIIVIIVSFLLIYFITWNLGRILKNSNYFKIKDIVTNGEKEELEFSYLKGRNVFNLDLKKESEYVSELYPTYKRIRLIRVLPNRLYVDFLKRIPLGIIKLYRYFRVDEDSVLFDASEIQEESNLPLILGLEKKIFGPKLGKKYNIRELVLAIDIIKEAKINKAFKDYKIKRIDVANSADASFFVSDVLKVKIGQGNIKDKLNILSGLLIQEKDELGNIEYIDLRFREPVIKFNEDKSLGKGKT